MSLKVDLQFDTSGKKLGVGGALTGILLATLLGGAGQGSAPLPAHSGSGSLDPGLSNSGSSNLSTDSGPLNETTGDTDTLLEYLGGLFESLGERDDEARDFNSLMAQIQQNFNASEADKARAYAEYVRSTQYQVAMEDLRKAGLNPILAYTNLSPAMTNTSPMATSGLASHSVSGGDTFSSVLTALASSVDAIGKIVELIKSGKSSNKIGF